MIYTNTIISQGNFLPVIIIDDKLLRCELSESYKFTAIKTELQKHYATN